MRFPAFGIGRKKKSPCEGDCCNGALWVKLTFRRMETGEVYEQEGCALGFIIEGMQAQADKEVKIQSQINKDIVEHIAPRITAGFQAVEKAITKQGEELRQLGG